MAWRWNEILAEDLSHVDPTDGVVRRYQLAQLIKQMPTALLIGIAIALILLFVLSYLSPFWQVAAWTVPLILASATEYIRIARKKPKQDLHLPVSASAIRAILIRSAVFGLGWGIGFSLFYPHGRFEYELLIMITIGGMSLGVIPVLGTVPKCAPAFFVALILPVFVRQLLIADPAHVILAILVFVYAVGLTAISVVATSAMTSALGMRFHNQGLVLDLKQRENKLRQAHKVAEEAQGNAEASAVEAQAKAGFLEVVLQNISQGLVVYDQDLKIVAWNEEFVKLLDMPEDFPGPINSYEDYLRFNAERNEYGPGDPQEQIAERLTALAPDVDRQVEKYERNRASGQVLEVIASPLPEGGLIKTYTDISERKRTELTIRRLAMRDPLTGLANRNQFNRELNNALEKAGYDGNMVGVLILDLDKFKPVNDTFGHPTGDKLLKVVAKRLLDCARGTDTVARLGGDEFAIVMNNIRSAEAVEPPAQRIIDSLSEPIVIDGYRHRIGTSIGISFFPLDDMDKSELLRKADVAMYEAKAAGRGMYKFYDADSHANAVASKILEDALRDGLAQDEFVLYYQPQVHGTTGELVGAEALIRWHRPGRGLVPPGDFIPAAETSGLIGPMGEWALFAACRQAAAWRSQGMPPIRVAVNVSVVQFHRDGFVNTVWRALEESNLDASVLEIEITEGAMMSDIDQVIKKMEELNEIGVCLAIDDFGTGYSSLAYLKKLPVHRLKIDKSFVDGVGLDPDDSAIADAVMTLGKTLKLEVVAEGVETVEQKAYLQERNCDIMQGYYFAAPMPASEFLDWYGRTEQNLLDKSTSVPAS